MLRAGRMGGVKDNDRVCAFAIANAPCCILVLPCACIYIYIDTRAEESICLDLNKFKKAITQFHNPLERVGT
jgi:hypothetical protein